MLYSCNLVGHWLEQDTMWLGCVEGNGRANWQDLSPWVERVESRICSLLCSSEDSAQ